MRYFLDTEFDGFGGALLSLALVPEDGGEEFYVVLARDRAANPWVERNVLPFLDMVPAHLQAMPLPRDEAASALALYLLREHDAAAGIEIVADWPEDIAQFCMLLLIGPAAKVEAPELAFRLVDLPGFSTAANSAVPHNALHDARALRDHLASLEV